LDVPFPHGFDTVLDFQFSPDDQAIAVTFGVTGCDYPGERARVYVVSLPEMRLEPISPSERLSVEPRWTPDGKTLVYVDYQGSDSPLVAFDLQTRKVTRLTSPGQFFGPDTWLGWR
jgi:Tol biopolymer transport system component